MKIKQPAPVCQPVQGNTSTYRHKIGRSILRTAGAAQRVCQPLVRRMGDRGRGRRLFLAYCVAMILFYAMLVRMLARPGFPLGGPGDFTAFYTAGHIIRDGNAHRLYDLELQTQVHQISSLLHGSTSVGELLPYNYPPFFAIVFVPLSLLPLPWAFYGWNVVNILLVLVSAKLLLHYQQKRSRRDFMTASLIAFAFLPVLQGLLNGQSSFVVLFTLTLAYLALKTGRDYLAGVALALGLIKPQLVIVIAIVMLYRQRWSTVLAFGLTAVTLMFISWMIVGTNGLISYVELIHQMSNWNGVHGVIYPARMANLRGTVYRLGQLYYTWFGTEPPSALLATVTLLVSAPVLVLTLRVWNGPWKAASPRFDLRFAQTVIGGLLLSPHLNGQDLTLLILVGFLLVSYFAHYGGSVKAHRMVAAGHVAPILSAAAMGAAWQAQVIALLLIAVMIILHSEGTHTTSMVEIFDCRQGGRHQT